MRAEVKVKLLLAALMIAMVLLFWDRGDSQSSISGGTIINSGSTTNPNPPLFSCPNDASTGTIQNFAVKLSASDTCIASTGAETTAGIAFLGVCVSNCGTSGSAQIATAFPIVKANFVNATTFGHWAALNGANNNGFSDSASVQPWASSVPYSAWGLILESGVAGVHPMMLASFPNPMLGGLFINSVTRLDTSAFSGQFRILPNGGGNTGCLQLGATGNNTSSGLFFNSTTPLLRVVLTGTNCTQGLNGTSGAATLEVAHLASDAANAPTIASGFGSSNQILGGGDLAFTANIGTGGTANNGIVTFASAFTAAPACMAQDLTSNVATRVTATTATNLTVTAAAAWTANDHIMVICMAQNGL